ncbi:NAD(P)-binding domain-containing protein [Salinisphaera sp. Q1T1-3]|uniref:NAD(P)-binding domain-containing protein n=1 Tax=Salinisphaera sp. Q1T1-3 TaxID=2321229 RepID=UPI000E73F4F5|nr:hypothetical protein D3260_07880 [Salinisphaera sp. Q1T1-3]
MKIGILGSGRMGATRDRLWARCGHDVIFVYSRNRARLGRVEVSCESAPSAVLRQSSVVARWCRMAARRALRLVLPQNSACPFGVGRP